MTITQFSQLMAELRAIRGALESLDAALPTLERGEHGEVRVSDAQPDGRSPNAPPADPPRIFERTYQPAAPVGGKRSKRGRK